MEGECRVHLPFQKPRSHASLPDGSIQRLVDKLFHHYSMKVHAAMVFALVHAPPLSPFPPKFNVVIFSASRLASLAPTLLLGGRGGKTFGYYAVVMK